MPNASYRWFDSKGNSLAPAYLYAKGGDLMFNYREYAGPLHVKYGGCGHANVVMKSPAGTVLVKGVTAISCD